MESIKRRVTVLLLIISVQLFAQKNDEKLIGKWQTEDKAIIEILNTNNATVIKQISANKEKDKKYNGKTIRKNIVFVNSTEYNVIMIDPANMKEYKGILYQSKDGKSLKLKVKWGILSFDETWTRQ
jgi:hypothetical protein